MALVPWSRRPGWCVSSPLDSRHFLTWMPHSLSMSDSVTGSVIIWTTTHQTWMRQTEEVKITGPGTTGQNDSYLVCLSKNRSRFYLSENKRPTSCTNMSSLILSGEMFLRRSMVSYMPCSSRSLSTEPSICFSSTRPTRNTIFTPTTTDLS